MKWEHHGGVSFSTGISKTSPPVENIAGERDGEQGAGQGLRGRAKLLGHAVPGERYGRRL